MKLERGYIAFSIEEKYEPKNKKNKKETKTRQWCRPHLVYEPMEELCNNSPATHKASPPGRRGAAVGVRFRISHWWTDEDATFSFYGTCVANPG
mmetsp:Transcript_16376/g.26506  ORF Transcript_16376/g.26506 Transcript_16376/m.26506 type:complete len:94 (-) Transcript_16376:125-406(-)